MRLNVRAELVFDFGEGTDAIVSVQAAQSDEQGVLWEQLTLTPPANMVQDQADERGERRFRARLAGEVRIVYEALVDNGRRIPLPPSVRKPDWLELPQSVLQYLSPSRYCPSDRFLLFANREFGHIADGGAQWLAVLDWLHTTVN